MNAKILVHGASGHTGRFVVAELLRRGLTPVVAGRSEERLAAVPAYQGLERRVLDLAADDLAADLDGIAVVINCAGPFLDTALPLAGAAVAAGVHYLDVTAEQPAVHELYATLDAPARAAGVAVVPAMAFYGGLADLLVTAVLDGGTVADEVDVAIGLDRWWPTAGTRATGARNTAPRMVVRDGALAPLVPATGSWVFGEPLDEPLGEQPVVALPFSETITLHRHLHLGELHSWLSSTALGELRDEATPPPTAADDEGRSAQRFTVDVVVRRGSVTSRWRASGRDIYAVSAPIVVEGAVRLLAGVPVAGAVAPGQAFDAADVLAALEQAGALAVQRD